jgi:uncharacterized protein (TIGR01777 family)
MSTPEPHAAAAATATRARRQVAVSGSSGMVGSALVRSLERDGYVVRRLVRSRPVTERGDIHWDPEGGTIDAAQLEGIDAVVHLAGEPLDKRWTEEQKRKIRESRVEGTRLLAEAIAALDAPPAVLITASAMGIYGDRGDEPLDEESTGGTGFLADVVRGWEAATAPAAEAGVRVVNLRFGVVLSPSGGALGRMLLPVRLGAGGRLGSGKQWMSWVALSDAVRAIRFAIDDEALRGAVNVVAPTPVTNADFTRALGKALHRPAVMVVPAAALRLAFGEMADEALLASQRVYPRRLAQAGFHFDHPEIEGALRYELEQPD